MRRVACRSTSLSECVARHSLSQTLLTRDTVQSRCRSVCRNASSNAADALVETLGDISDVDGRVATGNKLVLGGSDSLEKWRELDAKVNTYPTERVFKAIGSGGDEFVDSMVAVIRGVTSVEDVPAAARPSAKGNYVSVTLGPVMMDHSDQVIEVYQRMREDERLKWYL